LSDEQYIGTYVACKTKHLEVGNKKSVNGVLTEYAYDLNNRLLGENYDANGNQLTDGANVFAYDDFNRLISANGTTYTYRPDGLRHSKTTNGKTTTHVWDGSNISLDIVDGTAAKYVRGIGLIFSGCTFYLYNAHGDVVQLTDASGTLTREYDYDAFGNERGTVRYGDVDGDGVIDSADITLLRRYISAENKNQFVEQNPRFNLGNARVTGHSGNPNANDVATLRQYVAGFISVLGPVEDANPFRYAGKYLDFETNTYYVKARYYQPKTGRFTQEDPWWGVSNMIYGDNPREIGKDPLGLSIYAPDVLAIAQSGNLYSYALNNPIMWVDPTGKWLTPSWMSFTYNRGAAVDYALMWQEPNRNPVYPRYDYNCANFVSQAIVAGGLPKTSAWNLYWLLETRTTRAWHNANRQYQYFSTSGFANSTINFTSTGVNANAQSGNISPGDLIYFSRSSSSSGIYHAAMIVRVENGEIYYVHNTGPTGERQASLVTSGSMFVITLKNTGRVIP
jgi:RHS repeat-associated protein